VVEGRLFPPEQSFNKESFNRGWAVTQYVFFENFFTETRKSSEALILWGLEGKK